MVIGKEILARFISFSSPNTGVFKTQSNFEFKMIPLFNFDFHMYPNGVLLSHGDWEGDSGTFYQFQVTNATTFTITLYPKHSRSDDSNPSDIAPDADDEEFISSHPHLQEGAAPCANEDGCDDEIEVIVYSATKQVVRPEKTFVQKYSWVLIGGMIILNIYFQRKQRQPRTAPSSTNQKPQKSSGGGNK